jgi:ERCC4-type nuclease
MTLGDFTDIIIDKREPKEMESLFLDLEYGTVWTQHTSQESFDYRQGNVIIERKSMSDFVSSFKSDHLWDQLAKMQRYGVSYLIVVGSLYEGVNSKFGAVPNQILGAMGSIAVRYGIHPMIVNNNKEFAYLVGKLFQSHRNGNHMKHRKTRLTNTRKEISVAAKILSLVPGMDKKAEDIVKELNLKTIHDVTNLTYEKLQEVTGIGKKTALNILQYLQI